MNLVLETGIQSHVTWFRSSQERKRARKLQSTCSQREREDKSANQRNLWTRSPDVARCSPKNLGSFEVRSFLHCVLSANGSDSKIFGWIPILLVSKKEEIAQRKPVERGNSVQRLYIPITRGEMRISEFFPFQHRNFLVHAVTGLTGVTDLVPTKKVPNTTLQISCGDLLTAAHSSRAMGFKACTDPKWQTKHFAICPVTAAPTARDHGIQSLQQILRTNNAQFFAEPSRRQG